MPRGRGASAEPRIFHGWWIVLVAFICHAVNTGLVFYAWGVFLTPLAADFGGRGHVAAGYALMQLAAASYAVGIGHVVDRRGARPVQLAGGMALTIGFLAIARVDSLVGLYVCLAGPIALGTSCIGGPGNAAVARWFVRRRGQALGVSTAGISAGGIVFAPLAQFLIGAYGWRNAYSILGLMVAVLILPPVATLMRRDPADLGLLPDGGAPAAEGGIDASRALLELELMRSVRPEEALRQANFWLLAAAFGLTMAGLASVLLYQIPLLLERGMPAQRASLVLGATAAMGVIGKLGFGRLLDRFDQRRVAAACFCLQAAGVLLLWRTSSVPLLACYVVLYGYAMGGNATLQASLVGEAFGRLHYGAIAGRMTPFIVLAQAVGVPTTGYVRDLSGSYGPALGLVIACALAAAAIVLRVRLPPRPAPLQRRSGSRT